MTPQQFIDQQLSKIANSLPETVKQPYSAHGGMRGLLFPLVGHIFALMNLSPNQ